MCFTKFSEEKTLLLFVRLDLAKAGFINLQLKVSAPSQLVLNFMCSWNFLHRLLYILESKRSRGKKGDLKEINLLTVTSNKEAEMHLQTKKASYGSL